MWMWNICLTQVDIFIIGVWHLVGLYVYNVLLFTILLLQY